MHIITIECLYDNYSYLILTEDGKAAVVDPSEAWPVIKTLSERNLSLRAIWCTHHHHDHIGGIADLLDEYGDVRVIGFAGARAAINALSEVYEDGQQFDWDGIAVAVMHLPGHTETGIAFSFAGHIFVGDTLFGAGCGRLFEGTPAQMDNSLQRIAALDEQTNIYFGHEYTMVNLRFAGQVEPANEAIAHRLREVTGLRDKGLLTTPTTIALELRTNPFLRVDQPAVIAFAAHRLGRQPRDRVEVFGAIREARNSFS
jgi:hydroxyacylglutathione hydrolase